MSTLKSSHTSSQGVAVVLHMGQNGLGITRSLGRLGIKVYGIDWNPHAEAFHSKYCRRKFVFPHPGTDPEGCLAQFVKLGKSMQSPAVLMPAADYYVAFISRYETELAQHFHFNIPEASVLAMLMDKREQYKLAEESGVPIPKTFSLRSGDDLDKVSTLISYPAIVKGAHSHQWTSSFQGRKGYVAYSPDDLRRVSEQASTRGVEAVIQEMVLGPNHNHLKVCTYYSKDNELLAAFCTQKIRQYPVDMGIGTSMISIHTPELLELSCRFLEWLGYTGVSSIEFKKDERDGGFKLIELNPRFWQQNIQATHAQVNFANINYLDCLGQTVEPCLDFRQGIRWIDAFPDLRSFVSQSRKSNLSLLDWLRRVLDADCRAFLAKDDVRPVWKYVWNILGHIALHGAQTSPMPVSSLEL